MYSSYGLAFDGKGERSFGNDTAKNVIIFEVDESSASHTGNLKNGLLMLVEGPTFSIKGRSGASGKKIDMISVKQKHFACLCVIMMIILIYL